MKKILIITYYWPPAGGAGVQRWLKFTKYLRDFGWEPVIYTALDGEMPVIDESLAKDVPQNITVIKKPIWEPYNIYKKFIGRKKEDKINAAFLNENKKTGITEKISVWIRGNFFIPDARRFWIKPSTKFLKEYITGENISCIISTGPPHSMHLIARGIKRALPDVKWLADFRDPWTNIDFYEKLMLTGMADRKHRTLELSILQEADCIVSIGETMSLEFQEMYRASGGKMPGKFHVITNGFDDDDLPETVPDKDHKFSIAHIGTLVKDRNPEILWTTLKKLVQSNSEFEKALQIKLVGKVDFFVMEQLERSGLKAYLKKIDYLPHEKVIEEQLRSHVLLLLVNNTKNAKGILTGKFFEYMAGGVPILAIGPADGELASIINKTSCGKISGFEDAASLEKNILELFHGQSQNIITDKSQYSRKALTASLSKLLNSL